MLTLADMEEESGGKVSVTNYNCSNGRSAEGMDCPLQFGGGITTLSVDAGLMQINSGGWPATPKWNRVFGPGQSPYDPPENIAEGIRELNYDTAQCGG